LRRLSVSLAFAVLAAVVAAPAATPQKGTLSPLQRSIRWTGGPVTGAGLAGGPDPCPSVSCEDFSLTVDIGPSFWQRPGGGVAIRIQWEDRQDDLDLYVYDSAGSEVAHSFQVAGDFEEVFLAAPAHGTYIVRTVGFDGTAVTYDGRASVTSIATPAVRALPNDMQFTPPTIVDPQISAAEPGVLQAPGGRVFVTAPSAIESLSSHVWRSLDGARTFEVLDNRISASFADPRHGPCSDAIGGADGDLIFDRTGRLYFADLESFSVNVAVSMDWGDNWTCRAISSSTPLVDRPWLAPASTADGSGPNIDAYLAYTDAPTVSTQPVTKQVKPFEVHLDVTTDGGEHWTRRNIYARSLIHGPGRFFTGPDGTLYHAFTGENAVWLARSRDQGATVELAKVSQRVGLPANIFIGGDTDAAGNVFVAWVDSGTYDVLYSSSVDHGAHWRSPRRLNGPSSETAVMPWVAAGRAGDVAVAWYGAAADVSPGSAPASTAWHAWVARSRDAAAKEPGFEAARLSETPTHLGPICVGGQSCDDTAARSLADFFQIDIAPDGAIVAAYNDNGRLQDAPPQPYVLVTRQIAGLGMPPRSASVAGLERRGDARFPPRSGGGEDVPALDFSASPSVAWRADTLRLSFALASVGDPGSALTATNAGIATAATWLATWKANDRVEYAAMTTDVSGATSFFGGDHPDRGSDPRLYPYLTYPQQFPLEGVIDPQHGSITIDIPLGTFHLKPGDVLHSMQAFSLVGVPEGATFLSSQLVDMTPSQSLAIGTRSSGVREPRAPRVEHRGTLPATGLGGSPIALPALGGAFAFALWLRGPRRRKPWNRHTAGR